MPGWKIPGAKGASGTVVAVLMRPPAVTSSCDDVLPANPAGTSRLICVALLNRICAGVPSKLAVSPVPEKLVPMSVASDPGATGPVAKVAAFSTLVTVGEGGGGGGVVTVNVTGMDLAPASGPPSMTMVALYTPGVSFDGDASARMVPLFSPLAGDRLSQPEPF